MTRFFNSRYGVVRDVHWRRYSGLVRLADAGQNALQSLLGIRARALRRARALPVQRVLLAAVEVPGRERDLAQVIQRLRETRHSVTVATTTMQPRGKMANINAAIAPFDLDAFDWLLVVDDDIDFEPGFLDLLLGEAAYRGFRLAMPAHRQLSFASFLLTRRCSTSAARRTGFVEVGPVTLFHRSVFRDIIPFPEHKWAWGIDVHWAHLAARWDWPIGVVDVTVIRHLRPVAATYPMGEAIDEARAFLGARGEDMPREALLRTLHRYV